MLKLLLGVIMNKIVLLEGPDGNRYKGTLLRENIWSVISFANLRSSSWWINERQDWFNWGGNFIYTNAELKQTFTILSESETYIHPSNFIIHDAR